MTIQYITHLARSEPHTLIAGTTGSGKSNALNTIVSELIALNEAVILIDPKRVELKNFSRHRNCIGYYSETADIITIMQAMTIAMDNRYKTMTGKQYDGNDIYVIIDELADLMLTTDKRFRVALQRLLQLGRAAKIHIVTATQCPNRKVIPAEIVVNFTCRIALRCLSTIESRQIIGCKGAETLPRYGQGIVLNGEGYQNIMIKKYKGE